MFEDKHFEHELLERFDRLICVGEKLVQLGDKLMAGIDDFNQSLTDLGTSVGRIATDIAAALVILQNPNTSDAAFETAAQTVQGSVAQLNTVAGQLEAAEVPVTPAAKKA